MHSDDFLGYSNIKVNLDTTANSTYWTSSEGARLCKSSRFQVFLWYWYATFLLEKTGRLMTITMVGWSTSLSVISSVATLLVLWSLLMRSSWVIIILVSVAQTILNHYPPDDLWMYPSSIAPLFEHWLLALVGNLILVISVCKAMFTLRTFRPSLADIETFASPALRLLFILFLGYAGFSKLNDSFFSLTDSCTTSVANAMFLMYPIAPDFAWLRFSMPTLVVFAELICPFLLLIPAIRIPIALYSTVFFFMLGLAPFPNTIYDFAGLFLAILILFIPSQVVHFAVFERGSIFNNRITDLCHTSLSRLPREILTLLKLLFLAIAGGALLIPDLTNMQSINYFTSVPVWAVLNLIVAGICFYTWKISHTRESNGSLLRTRGIIIPALLILVFFKEGLTYVGVQHRPAFKMASGMAVSRYYSNHFLITKVPDLGFNRLATITESNDPHLLKGTIFSWTPLHSYLIAHPEYNVSVDVEGTLYQSQKLTVNNPFDYVWRTLKLPLLIPTQVDSKPTTHCSMHYEDK